MYGPHPKEKRYSLISSFINIGIICLVILIFIGEVSSWYIIPLIILSFIIFCCLGASLSGGSTTNSK